MAMTDATGKIEWDITVTTANYGRIHAEFAGQWVASYVAWA